MRKNHFQEHTAWFVSPLSFLKRCSIGEGPLPSSLFPPRTSPPHQLCSLFPSHLLPAQSALSTFLCHYNLLPFWPFLCFLSHTPHFLCIFFSLLFLPTGVCLPLFLFFPVGPMMFQVELVGMGAQFQGHREGMAVQKGDHQKKKRSVLPPPGHACYASCLSRRQVLNEDTSLLITYATPIHHAAKNKNRRKSLKLQMARLSN